MADAHSKSQRSYNMSQIKCKNTKPEIIVRSLFVVREIDSQQDRNLVAWRYITFDQLAQYASWVFRSGGPGMTGARSETVRIPAEQFQILNAEALRRL